MKRRFAQFPERLLMPFFKPSVLSPKQIERRNRIRARGRKRFVFYTGVLGWGMSMFVVMTLLRWHGDYGWRGPCRGDVRHEIFLLAVGLIIWSTAGYLWGTVMWKKLGSVQAPGKEPGGKS
jgi:hypothetical protein